MRMYLITIYESHKVFIDKTWRLLCNVAVFTLSSKICFTETAFWFVDGSHGAAAPVDAGGPDSSGRRRLLHCNYAD